MIDKIPLITKKQAAHITKMFKSGKFLPTVLAYLDYTLEMHRSKLDPSYMHCNWSSFDPVYRGIIERAHGWLENYWLEQIDHMDTKNWQFIMRAKFGWSTNAPYREPQHDLIKLQPDKPSKLLDTVIQQVTDGRMSAEKGKAISDLVIQSYNVKEIESEAEPIPVHGIKESSKD